MKHLVSKTLSLVGTCESAYALLEIATEMPAEINKVDAKRFKTRRESMAGHGDKELLKFLLKR